MESWVWHFKFHTFSVFKWKLFFFQPLHKSTTAQCQTCYGHEPPECISTELIVAHRNANVSSATGGLQQDLPVDNWSDPAYFQQVPTTWQSQPHQHACAHTHTWTCSERVKRWIETFYISCFMFVEAPLCFDNQRGFCTCSLFLIIKNFSYDFSHIVNILKFIALSRPTRCL